MRERKGERVRVLAQEGECRHGVRTLSETRTGTEASGRGDGL
jgi:hypothetical protein